MQREELFDGEGRCDLLDPSLVDGAATVNAVGTVAEHVAPIAEIVAERAAPDVADVVGFHWVCNDNYDGRPADDD